MNIRQLKKKVKTVNNIKKMTHAMEMVSAVKMKKSQQKAIEGRPYQQTLDRVVKTITQMIDPGLSPLLKKNFGEKSLAILISTNKGLCGAFNFNLFRFCLDNFDFKNTDFITIGKIGSFFINKMGGKIIGDYSMIEQDAVASAVYNQVISLYLKAEYSNIFLVFNRFISTVNHQPVKEKLLPIEMVEKEGEVVNKLEESYLIEPKPEMIIDPLLRNFIEQKIRAALISHEAGEHSARMLAMKNASDNAEEIIQELTLTGNKIRQEKITYELLDMVTAKESVEK